MIWSHAPSNRACADARTEVSFELGEGMHSKQAAIAPCISSLQRQRASVHVCRGGAPVANQDARRVQDQCEMRCDSHSGQSLHPSSLIYTAGSSGVSTRIATHTVHK